MDISIEINIGFDTQPKNCANRSNALDGVKTPATFSPGQCENEGCVVFNVCTYDLKLRESDRYK